MNALKKRLILERQAKLKHNHDFDNRNEASALIALIVMIVAYGILAELVSAIWGSL